MNTVREADIHTIVDAESLRLVMAWILKRPISDGDLIKASAILRARDIVRAGQDVLQQAFILGINPVDISCLNEDIEDYNAGEDGHFGYGLLGIMRGMGRRAEAVALASVLSGMHEGRAEE